MLKKYLSAAFFLLASHLSCVTWTGAASDQWANTLNWTPNAIPGIGPYVGYDVTFDSGGDVYIGFDINATIGAVYVNMDSPNRIDIFSLTPYVNKLTINDNIIFNGNALLAPKTYISMPNNAIVDMETPNSALSSLYFYQMPFVSGGTLRVKGPGAFYALQSPFTATLLQLESGAVNFVSDFTGFENIGTISGIGGNTHTVTLTGDANQTIPTNFQGSLKLTVNPNVGVNLTLSGTNTYTGITTITTGTLTGNTSTIPSNNIVNNSNLVFDQGTSATFSGNISGSGTLTKSSAGALTLSGSNSYAGTTTISAGNLIGTTASIPSNTTVNNATLTFNQSSDGSFSGNISGSGALVKSGGGIVTYSGEGSYTGATTISAGTLSVTNTIADSVLATVSSGATLKGSGTVCDVQNNGKVIAGVAAGDTLAVSGTYDQDGSATFTTLVTPSLASKATVTGVATLDGTLQLVLANGIYVSNTTYTVFSSDDSIVGNFSTLSQSVSLESNLLGADTGNWQFQKVGNNITITLQSPLAVTPVPLSSLKGNSKVMGNYIFFDPTFDDSNADLMVVTSAMVALSGPEFEEALVRVSPLATAANVFTTFQSDLQMAVVLDKQFEKKAKLKNSRLKDEFLCSATPKTGLFIEPIGVFYNQRSVDGNLDNAGQVAFDSYTYGTGLGWDQVLGNQFILEGGVGYTHSNLNWKDNFGNSKWSTFYCAPFFGWFNQRVYANFMVMGAFNFFNTERRIQFQGFERVATSKYTSYDLLLRINGGVYLPMGENFWFQADGTVNDLTIFTSKYTEKGAGSISLQTKRRVNYILQPSVRAKIIKEYKSKKICYTPNLYVGWLSNILLKRQTLSARFVNAPNQIFFSIEGYQKTTNQLILGAEYEMQRFGKFILSTNFEADILSHFEVYTAKIKFEWLF